MATVKYQSKRGIQLVAQAILGNGTLTVVRYEKWYDFYIIDKKGVVHPLWESEYLTKEVVNTYDANSGDHCVNPKDFVEIAGMLGLEYDTETLNYVICMWIEQYLDYDTSRINEYSLEGHNFTLLKGDQGFFIFGE